MAVVVAAPCVMVAMTCGVGYSPMLANVLACSSTVSDAWPSALPTSSRMVPSPDASVLTPNACAIWMMFWPSVPATGWYRSVYALLSDMADAVTPLTPPRLPSPASLATSYHWEELAGCFWLANVSGCATGGIHSGELPFSVLVWTSMPCDRARASTYGLNEDPTCSLFCSAISNWQ